MTTLRVIKEPIHNYIPISNLESELINDPLFQRLHHISQNGTAYLTYPSNRTSRFVHSLGTMHLGGLMLRAALFNSENVTKRAFLGAFTAIMKEAEKAVNFRIHQVGESLSKSNDICYRSYGFNPEDADAISAIVLFQCVRIACVLHDLGHPPFSHTTEVVMQSKIDAYVPSGTQQEYKRYVEILTNLRKGEPGHLHEMMGTVLTEYIFSETSSSSGLAQYGRFCFWIASKIANSEAAGEDPNGVLRCLGKIVSRDGFDADRGDYVLRDGYASSFEFGQYDLTRILDNLRFWQQPTGDFELVATTTATSALESYFLERYRIWRWLVFHHSVTQGHVALARALAILFEIAFGAKPRSSQESAIKRILVDWDFSLLWGSFENSNRYRQYVRCDEHWLL